uniref:DUF4433 domain-containing protein n=1 Tax=Desulfatirhabdium butyrativorans TaxID=340467 RepID=A0A7C4RUL2_9BACT
MPIPHPTTIYRLLHIDNLAVILDCGGMHAPNHPPEGTYDYRVIHNVDIQMIRRQRRIPCGPGGTVHDYVAFYFGPRPPMLLQLHTGRVEHYNEGQEPLIYAVSTVETIVDAKLEYVFSDGHGIAAFTQWFDDLNDLDKVDWDMAYADYWADTVEDMDRQRRKQAEFLVHRFCPWEMVNRLGVLNEAAKERVERILNQKDISTPVEVCRRWYY